jgi:hypothetical protein
MLLAVLFCQKDSGPLQGWIEKLAADRIEDRDLASKKLLELGDSAIPLLKKALEGPDPERRARCRDILARMEFARTKVEAGARVLAGVGIDVPDVGPDPRLKKEFENLLGQGKRSDIVDKDYTWLPCAIDGILSDEKAVAEGSLLALHEIIKKRGVPAEGSDLVRKPNLKEYFFAERRAEEYVYWAQWWFTMSARDLVRGWDRPGSADVTDWVRALEILRSGNGEGDPDSPEARIFKKVQSMGKRAYPSLVRFIDDEDPALRGTAQRLLHELSGRPSKELTEKNKADLRKEWEAWLESKN